MEPTDFPPRPIPGDVVQVAPNATRWGPVFLVVTECKDWGVLGYFIAHGGDAGGSHAYLRVPHGSYVRIGIAQWWSG